MNIPLFPLNTVLFPQGLLPLRVFEVRYTDMVRDCLRTGTPFGVVNISRGSDFQIPNETPHEQVQPEKAQPEHHAIGTLATVVDFDMVEPAVLMIAAKGGLRFKVLSTDAKASGLIYAHIQTLEPDPEHTVPQALLKSSKLLEQIIGELEKQQKQAEDAGHKTFCFPIAKPYALHDAGWVANRFAELMPMGRSERQALLEQVDCVARLTRITEILSEKEVL